MPIDYPAGDQLFGVSFQRLAAGSAPIGFATPGTLALQLSKALQANSTLPNRSGSLFASSSVEMWHRAIHSFLLSVALTETSPLWASVTGYYASHFVMRAVCHSIGVFKLFSRRSIVQVILRNGNFVCSMVSGGERGEHAFYWNVARQHPNFSANPLFRDNSERNLASDSAHRNFANYTDHVGRFTRLSFPLSQEISLNVEKISRIRLHSVTEPSREDYPDLFNVQILAFQRIVSFHDFLETRVPGNRFWRAHRRPSWCDGIMVYQVEEDRLEQPLTS